MEEHQRPATHATNATSRIGITSAAIKSSGVKWEKTEAVVRWKIVAVVRWKIEAVVRWEI